jgi:hypothetical protein
LLIKLQDTYSTHLLLIPLLQSGSGPHQKRIYVFV